MNIVDYEIRRIISIITANIRMLLPHYETANVFIKIKYIELIFEIFPLA